MNPTATSRRRRIDKRIKAIYNMARKSSANHAGIYLYKKDIFASARCRALSREGAGVYFFLLLHLADMPQKGVYSLREWSEHPDWKKSDYRKCLTISDKRDRLRLFAKWLAKNDLPWDKTEVLPCLQELYDRGIIIVEGDMLIQPRMARENGFRLPDIDHDGDPEPWTELEQEAAADPSADGPSEASDEGDITGTENGTHNTPQKDPISHAPAQAGATRAHSKRVGVRDNNIKDNNSKGNTGGVGDAKPEKENAENTPQGTAAAPRRQAKGKAATAQRPVSEQPPTQEEVSAYWQERAEQGKPLLYISAEEFYATCETDGWTHGKDRKPIMNWKTFALGCDTYRRNHGDRPVGARPSAAAPQPRSGEPVKAEPNKDGQGKYRKW